MAFMYEIQIHAAADVITIQDFVDWVSENMEADTWSALESYVQEERNNLINHMRYIDDGNIVHSVRFFETEAAATDSLARTKELMVSSVIGPAYSNVTEVSDDQMNELMLKDMNGL